jgi:hypothetical protein
MTIHFGTAFRRSAIDFFDIVTGGCIPSFGARVPELIFPNPTTFVLQIHILILLFIVVVVVVVDIVVVDRRLKYEKSAKTEAQVRENIYIYTTA